MSNYKHYNNYNYKFVVFLWILNQNLIRILISENIKKSINKSICKYAYSKSLAKVQNEIVLKK